MKAESFSDIFLCRLTYFIVILRQDNYYNKFETFRIRSFIEPSIVLYLGKVKLIRRLEFHLATFIKLLQDAEIHVIFYPTPQCLVGLCYTYPCRLGGTGPPPQALKSGSWAPLNPQKVRPVPPTRLWVEIRQHLKII